MNEEVIRLKKLAILLRERLRPFAQAWRTATEAAQGSPKLTMAQLGALAKHEIGASYFQDAFKTLRDVPEEEI